MPRTAIALVGTALALTLLALAATLSAGSFGPVLAAPPATVPALPPVLVDTVPVRSKAAPPVRLRVARLGLDARLVGLRVQRDGSLAAPADYQTPGWYRDGAVPGDPGPAVIVGHVDSKDGPGVFHGLRTLRAGDPVEVRRADGSNVRFLVERVVRVGKDRFPTAEVYGATAGPTLRLITCGGRFDRRTGHYTDNVIAFARLAPAPTVPRSV